MDYVRIDNTDRLELLVQEDDEVYATVTPKGVYRVYHALPGARHETLTNLFAVPDPASKSLTVMALSGLWPKPSWQATIPVREEDQQHLLPYLGDEQVITVRDPLHGDIQITLRQVMRMQAAMAINVARSNRLRAHMSDRRHMIVGVLDWLQASWDRYQLATGMAREIRRPYAGRYDDPYTNTCQPLPDGWERQILAFRSKIITMLDDYEMRTDVRPRPDDFWPQWHAGWETDVLTTLQLMAAPYGWTRVHNPREVQDSDT